MNKKTIDIIIRSLIVLVVAVLVVVAAIYLFKLLYPFIIAAFLVVLINPLIRFFEKKARFPRVLAVLTTLLLFFSVFAGAITFLIAEIIEGTTYLADVVPEKVDSFITGVQTFFTQTVLPFYEGIADKFNTLDASKQATIQSSIQEASNKLSGSATSFIQNFLTSIPSLVSWIPSAATAIVFILLATFFISKDWDRLSSKFTPYIPDVITTRSRDVYEDIKKAGLGFIRAQFILMGITFSIVFVGLLIMQVNQALTIALIIAVVDLLPYLGTSAVLVPWALYQFFTGNILMGVGLSIVFVVVGGTRQFIEPKVLSSSLNLDPLSTLIALFAGFQLFGFLGLIIGPISLVFGMTLYRTGVFHDVYKYIMQRAS